MKSSLGHSFHSSLRVLGGKNFGIFVEERKNLRENKKSLRNLSRKMWFGWEVGRRAEGELWNSLKLSLRLCVLCFKAHIFIHFWLSTVDRWVLTVDCCGWTAPDQTTQAKQSTIVSLAVDRWNRTFKIGVPKSSSRLLGFERSTNRLWCLENTCFCFNLYFTLHLLNT